MTVSRKPIHRWFKRVFSKKHIKRYWPWYGLVLLLLLFYPKSKHDIKITPPSVVVASAQKKDVPIYVYALGNVVAVNTVTINTQINGLLMKIHYKEGQFVKKGMLLAEIDDRPYLAQLTQYQGQLLHDQALLDNANIDLKRYQTLWRQDSISEQTLATQVALVKEYQGTVEADKGLIQSTKVNLIYCHITAPVDGRIGLRLIDPGNFVQTSNTTGLAVITTTDPITVIFSIPEDEILDVLGESFAHKPVVVEAYDRNEKHLLAKGRLLAMDNQINTATGTLNLRAKFSNKENKLVSNQFVNIHMLVNTLHQVLVVPTASVQHGNKGDYVYKLNADSTVSLVWVKSGVMAKDDTVILRGLNPGDKVVTEGADGLSNGVAVKFS